jgi:hypothetical protein
MLGVVFSERRRRLQVYRKTIRCLWTVFVNKSNKSQIHRNLMSMVKFQEKKTNLEVDSSIVIVLQIYHKKSTIVNIFKLVLKIQD